MKRDIERDLLAWKNNSVHLPIILRGARQIGKTHVVRQFARENFLKYVEVNFEFEPKFKKCFESLDPIKIIPQLEILVGTEITAPDTLLFLDEIQECPNALMALRYFKENMPDLHVIAAGSLLEFIFNESHFRMPVGRVQFLHMKPFSFKEFLVAVGRESLRVFLENLKWGDEIPEPIHTLALELVRDYCILGGMPAVINRYLENRSFASVQETQSQLLLTYQNDFGKYTQGNVTNYCRLIFTKAPHLVARQFKYVQIAEEIQSRALKPALMKLVQSGVIHTVYGTAASGLPLNALLNEKKVKLLFLDIGLMKRAGQLDTEALLHQDLLLINQGQLMEQFVGQELLAYQEPSMPPEIYFWARDARGSSAEVDFVVNFFTKILPIEVKSGGSQKMKSVKLLMDEKKLKQAVRVSTDPLSKVMIDSEKDCLNIPFYLIGELQRWFSGSCLN
jgi:predicted AAA+ superfamily ATPase